MILQKLDMKMHYPLLIEWWTKRKCPIPDPTLLPPTAFICFAEEQPICAGFLYKSDGGVATISHLVASTEAAKEVRDECMDHLLMGLMAQAISAGYKCIGAAASPKLKGLEARYERLGLKKIDENINHFGRMF